MGILGVVSGPLAQLTDRIVAAATPVMQPLVEPATVLYEAVASLPRLADGLAQLGAMDGTLARIAEFDTALDRIGGVAESLERVAAFETILERIASYGESLAGLADMSAVLNRLATALDELGALVTSVEALQSVAGELTNAVQPLQGAAQRLGRIVGGRKAAPAPTTGYPTLPS